VGWRGCRCAVPLCWTKCPAGIGMGLSALAWGAESMGVACVCAHVQCSFLLPRGAEPPNPASLPAVHACSPTWLPPSCPPTVSSGSPVLVFLPAATLVTATL
jgi:hypothetical protein